MKNLFIHMAFCVCAFASFIQAAIPPDTNVTLMKVKKVTIEDSRIVIVAEQATTIKILGVTDSDPFYKGDTLNGKPVIRMQFLSNDATFIIEQDGYSKPGGSLENMWKSSFALARELQEGKEVGAVRIAFYLPEIVIKGKVITSVIGSGYLDARGN